MLGGSGGAGSRERAQEGPLTCLEWLANASRDNHSRAESRVVTLEVRTFQTGGLTSAETYYREKSGREDDGPGLRGRGSGGSEPSAESWPAPRNSGIKVLAWGAQGPGFTRVREGGLEHHPDISGS